MDSEKQNSQMGKMHGESIVTLFQSFLKFSQIQDYINYPNLKKVSKSRQLIASLFFSSTGSKWQH